jgi:hypothetical protein
VIRSPGAIPDLVRTLAGTALLLAVSGCTAASPSATSGGASEPVESGARAVSEAPSAEPSTGPLGGGLILVHGGYDEQNPSPLDVFALDAGTGHRTRLGTLPEGWGPAYRNRYTFQWGADRKHVLVTDFQGQWLTTLENPTDAARDLIFVCCEPAREVLPNGEGTQALEARGWVLSPQSDQVAGLKERQIHVPGCLLCSAPGAIVILDVDRGDIRTLPLPAGTQGNGPISWSPDGSAVVISGCRPCNNAGIVESAGGPSTPTAIEHGHLFVVPLDGSPVRELLDEADAMFGAPAWSLDATTIAFARHECRPAEHAPDCLAGTDTLVTVAVADGRQTVIEKGIPHAYGPMWSPDGRRITFVDDRGVFVMDADGSHVVRLIGGYEPRWSPDGQWLLVSSANSPMKLTVIAADGGESRVLGTYGGGAW